MNLYKYSTYFAVVFLMFSQLELIQMLCEWLAPSELPAIRRVKGSPVMHFIRL